MTEIEKLKKRIHGQNRLLRVYEDRIDMQDGRLKSLESFFKNVTVGK